MTALLSLLMAAAQPPGNPRDLRTNTAIDATEIRLSESVRVRLSVEGPTPLRVTPPARILTAESFAVWKIRVVELPTVTPIDSGRERWTLTITLDPYIAGTAVRIGINPFEAVAGSDPTPRTVYWPTKTVRVISSVKLEDDTRPVTGIEPTPPAPPVPPSRTIPIAVGAVVLGIALTAGVLRIRSRRNQPLSPYALAERQLRDDPTAEGISDSVRSYVEARFAVPATRLTTAELRGQVAELPSEAAAVLIDLLDRCDEEKFAARPAGGELADRARRFLDLTRQSPPG